MSVGKRDGIRPADVVGSIANEADVPGRDIGPIEIQDNITYVTVPAEFVEKIVAKVGRARFRGKAVNLRVAGPGEGRSERAPARFKREDRRPPFRDKRGPKGKPRR